MVKKAKPQKPPAKRGKKTALPPAVKKPPAKRKPADDDDLYDQGDIAAPRRDPPYEDGL